MHTAFKVIQGLMTFSHILSWKNIWEACGDCIAVKAQMKLRVRRYSMGGAGAWSPEKFYSRLIVVFWGQLQSIFLPKRLKFVYKITGYF